MTAGRTTGGRVVVTGIGAVSALGVGVDELWRRALAGHNGARAIQAFDLKDYRCTAGYEVDNAALQAALAAEGLRGGDRTVDFALLAAAQALREAGLYPEGPPPAARPIGVILGTGAGPARSTYESVAGFFAGGVRAVRPTSIPRCMISAVAAQVSMRFRLTGPNYIISSACTSATNAIGTAFRMIRDGYATQVLCGGAESLFDPMVYAGWNNLGVVSRNPDPQKACRPFDAARDGCVLGEGAAVLMLESAASARARGARIRGEIAGYGESSDAQHITSPSDEGQAAAMRAALADAGLRPDEIGYVNAHGTATRANDECEARSIRLALGDAADRVPVASSKSLVGHLLGAAGAIETVLTLLGLEAGRVPPNVNLDQPDPACHLCLVGGAAQALDRPAALKNSFGFGGGNGVLALRRWDA